MKFHWMSFSESSHTRRAAHAVRQEFAPLGFRVALSDPVPDKFPVKDPAGSYRGLSRGVAHLSRYPLFSPRDPSVHPALWASSRLLYSVVQFFQVPIHVVTLYLIPNAVPGSEKYERNCSLVRAAVQILAHVNGPAMLCGDFNIPWRHFQDLRDLALEGWVDSHEVSSARWSEPLEPTCKSATRHTFGLVNAGLLRFLVKVQVVHRNVFDSHAVLQVEFDLPIANVPVWKWRQPFPLDDFNFDKETLQSEVPTSTLTIPFQQALTAQDPTLAFSLWSQGAERTLLDHAHTETGPVQVTKQLTGRGQQWTPTKRVLAAPRPKHGRAQDFRTEAPAVSLRARQLLKQARRLQSLCRLLTKLPSAVAS